MAGRDSVTPGHQEMVTVTTPWLRLAIWVNSCSDRSTTRPGSGFTVVDRTGGGRPVASLRTVRTTPWAASRWRSRPGTCRTRSPPGCAVARRGGGGGGCGGGRRGRRRRRKGRGRCGGRRGAAVVVVDGAAAVDGADVVEAGSRARSGRGSRPAGRRASRRCHRRARRRSLRRGSRPHLRHGPFRRSGALCSSRKGRLRARRRMPGRRARASSDLLGLRAPPFSGTRAAPTQKGRCGMPSR